MPDDVKIPELYSVTIKLNSFNSQLDKYVETSRFKSVLVFATTFFRAKVQAMMVLRNECDLGLVDYDFYVVAKVTGLSPETYRSRAILSAQTQISTKGM